MTIHPQKNQKNIIVSLSFVILTAFITHYFFISRIQNKTDQGRNLASFAERNSKQQIQWENKIAQGLSANEKNPQKPAKAVWLDQLTYEFLQGKYAVITKSGQIEKLSAQNKQKGLNFNLNDLMKNFGQQIKSFSNYKIIKRNEALDEIELLSSSGQKLGLLTVEKNSNGEILEIIVK